jgi:tRNA (guanine6-N2)-methyltransferase
MPVRLTARCVRGLEWILAAEVEHRFARYAADDIQLSERQVSFEVPRVRTGLLDLRTADDLLLDVGTLRGIDHTRAALTELSRRLTRIDFAAALARLGDVRALPSTAPTFDVVASLLGRRNYNRYAVEDTAGDVIADAVGARYASRNPNTGRTDTGHAGTRRAADTADTDFTVRLSLNGDSVEVALRLPRKPLHRRPWKLDTGPGTLHPPLAAALVQLGAEQSSSSPFRVLDPFCGDGTIAIEAAFAFLEAEILAADLDADRLRNARANATRAAVAERIEFLQADAGSTHVGTTAPGTAASGTERFDVLVTNPPWNRSVGAAGALSDTLDPFWRRLPDVLTPHGRICTVAEADLDVPARLRRMGCPVALAQSIRLAGRVSGRGAPAPGRARTVARACDQVRDRLAGRFLTGRG